MSGNKRAGGNPAWVKGGPSPNPAGRGSKRTDAAPTERADGGWANLATGMNIAGRDKRAETAFTPDVITVEDALNLWRGDDLAARIIEEPVNDAMREGFRLFVAEDDEQAAPLNPDGSRDNRAQIVRIKERRAAREMQKRITQMWEDLDLLAHITNGMQYERAYGGAALLLGVNDGQSDLKQPLNLKAPRIKLEWLTVLEPREAAPIGWYSDPSQRKFGLPQHYQINPQNPGTSLDPKSKGKAPTTVVVHESRLVIFPGIVVSRRPVAKTLSGWGDSILTRVYRILRDYNAAFDSVGALLQDIAQAVFKMKGLAEIISSDNASKFKTRMELVNYSRSALRAILLDAELEEFERKGTPLTGVPDLLDRIERRLGAASGMPLTRLIGMSPGGLNATGESDTRFYYDTCRSLQTKKAEPAIRYITQILFRSIGGEPADWAIKFPPLWQPSDKERAETRKLIAETDAIYLDRSVVDGDEVAKSRWGGDEFNDGMLIDFDQREDLNNQDPADPDSANARDPNAQPVPQPGAQPQAKPLTKAQPQAKPQ